jgi:hypothetical protein
MEWATKHGHDGLDPASDYMALCKSCHRKYDMTDATKAKIRETVAAYYADPEHRAKAAAYGSMSRGSQGRGPDKSPESKARRSEAAKHRKVKFRPPAAD